MRLYLVLGLLFVGARAEKKLNLDDIERDNLRAEKNQIKPDDAKYQYQYTASTPATFVTPPPIEEPKYAPPQAPKYETGEPAYQQNSIYPEQQNLPLQYYTGYQSQFPATGKGLAGVYEQQQPQQQQQFIYQPEVVVGNQLQSVQQKAITEKYAKNIGHETLFVDIPANHFLSYYPHLGLGTARGNGLPLAVPQLATSATQQVSIPVYTPSFSQKPIQLPVKHSIQIPYAPKYTTVVPNAYTTKLTKGLFYTPKKFTGSFLGAPFYVQPDVHQTLSQGKKLLYTQAYLAPQTQYVPQFVYTQPIYTNPGQIYHGQDNNVGQSQGIYLETGNNKQVAQQQTVTQDYVQVPEEPKSHFVPPHRPAQNFRSGVTQLLAVPDQPDESFGSHDGSSEPRSLLESYVPSKVIAAQDSARYRERPLKLEGGFLPSRENFLHKKRKTD